MNRDDAWNSHQWASAKPRLLKIEPEKPLRLYHCSRCGRDFVESLSSERWAVHVSVFSFQILTDHISTQWLGEMCPGALMPFDIEVRNRLDHHAK